MEIPVSPHRKRRGAMRGELRAKKDAARECAQILKGVSGSEEDGCSEDSKLKSRDNGSVDKNS